MTLTLCYAKMAMQLSREVSRKTWHPIQFLTKKKACRHMGGESDALQHIA
jgi:hypothetical protein